MKKVANALEGNHLSIKSKTVQRITLFSVLALGIGCSQLENPAFRIFTENLISIENTDPDISPPPVPVHKPVTISLQGRDKCQDGHVWSLKPDQVRGDYYFFNAMAWTWDGEFGVTRSFVKFDLSQIPANARIVSASLSLYQNQDVINNSSLKDFKHSQLSGSNACLLQRITSPWSESSISWNTQPTTTTQNQVMVPASTDPVQDYTLDVTTIVREMVTPGATNYGFMLRLVDEMNYRCVMFASMDSKAPVMNDPSVFPRLDITYANDFD
jgi:hypothetical protein